MDPSIVSYNGCDEKLRPWLTLIDFEGCKENISMVSIQKIKIYWNHSYKRLTFSLDIFRNKLLLPLLLEYGVRMGNI